MNFVNRYFWNSFSSIPATSPSSTNSSPCSRPFLTSSYATCSQESPHLRSVSHEKADKILTQLYPSFTENAPPSFMLNPTPVQFSLDEMDKIMISKSNSNNSSEISVLTDDSPSISLTIDLSMINKSNQLNPPVEDIEIHDNEIEKNDFLTSFRKLQQKQKKSPPSTAVSVSSSSDDASTLMTKNNLQNTNSVLINRNEFDILLRKKLVKEQKKAVAASLFSSVTTSSRSDAVTRRNQWIPSYSQQNQQQEDNRTNSNASDISDGTEDLMKVTPTVDGIIDFSSPVKSVVMFICPEGTNRIHFQNDSPINSHNNDDANMKIFSKTARLSSLYQKYTSSASSFLSFSSTSTFAPDPAPPSVTVRKAYGKPNPVPATVVKSSKPGLKRQYSHDDCNPGSSSTNSGSCESSPDQNCRLIPSECSATPTNSPNFSAKYSKFK
jgi:hypothetical protein